MQCSKCGNPKVIIKKEQSGQYLCKDCFIDSIEKKVIKTVRKEKLLDKGDKVLVALSGGKDSIRRIAIPHPVYDPVILHSFLKKRENIISDLIYQMNTPAVDVQHDIETAAPEAMDQTHIRSLPFRNT